MATTTLKKGSSDYEAIKSLQQKLMDENYDVGATGADGIYGKNTEAAVKAYQADHGLTVDGIAGTNTLGSLNKKTSSASKATTTATNTNKNTGDKGNVADTTATATPAATPTTATQTPTYTDFTYDPYAGTTYAMSDNVQQAWNIFNEYNANKPGAYQSSEYQTKADSYLSQYENRDPFSYDFNSDALYNQYKDQYIQQGQMAMMDTMGQAAAMTGGYGNSYAQTVGQQAYNQSLSQLNEIMPELYQMAYDRYVQEGQDMLNMHDLYMGREQYEYDKYQDEVANYFTGLANARDTYGMLYDQDYGAWYNQEQMNYDAWKTNTGLAYDEWATNTGIAHDLNLTNINNTWQSNENQLDRDWKTDESQKERDWQSGESQLDRDWKSNESQLDREHDTSERIASQNYNTSESDKDRAEKAKNTNYNNLVSLAATGHEPSDGELKDAGMTREQYNAIKESYKTGTPGKETTASADEIDAVEKKFEKCTNPNALASLAEQLLAEGWSETWVGIMANRYDRWGTGAGGGGVHNTYIPQVK